MFCFFKGRKTLPGVYDESLSYYEQLCRLEQRIDTIQLQGGYSLTVNVELPESYEELENIKLNDQVYVVPQSQGMTNPMTTAGDIIVGGESGAAQRLGKGSNGDVLKIKNGAVAWDAPDTQTVEGTDVQSTGETSGKVLTANGSGGAAWQAPASGMENPMTTAEDLIKGGVDGEPARLGKGNNGQVLGVDNGQVKWVNPQSGMINPMGYAGDMIVGGSSGSPTRLGSGTNGQVLTIKDGSPAWDTPTVEGYNVKSSNATSNRFLRSDGAGGTTWSQPNKDTISSSGATNGQVLTANGSGGCQWTTPSGGGSGMTNPMTATGDMIVATAGGTPQRLGVGTEGQVLTIGEGGSPEWVSIPAQKPTEITIAAGSNFRFTVLSALAQLHDAISLTLNFTSNSTNYTGMSFDPATEQISYNADLAYDGSWQEPDYQDLTFSAAFTLNVKDFSLLTQFGYFY